MKAQATHYWTGRGTLCSLDNSVKQRANHVSHWPAVNCRYCLYVRDTNAKSRPGKEPHHD